MNLDVSKNKLYWKIRYIYETLSRYKIEDSVSFEKKCQRTNILKRQKFLNNINYQIIEIIK